MEKIIIGLLVMLSLVSCNQISNDLKKMDSQFVGYKQIITTVLPTGEKIIWKDITAHIEYESGGSIYFIDKDGKAHTVPSNFTWIDQE